MEDKDNIVQEETVEETVEELDIHEESEDLKNAKAGSGIMVQFLDREYPVIGSVRIYHPTLDVDSEVELCYVEQFNLLMEEGKLPTFNKMEKILKDRGEWTDKDNDEIESIINKIGNKQIDIAHLRREMKVKKKTSKATTNKFHKLNTDLARLYSELAAIQVRKSSLFQGTIERRAERKALLLKLSRCVKRPEDDSPVWNTTEDLGNFSSELAKPLIADAMKFWKGVDSPLSGDLLDLISGR